MWVLLLLLVVVISVAGFYMVSRNRSSQKDYLNRRRAIENLTAVDARGQAEQATATWKKERNAPAAKLGVKQPLGQLTAEFLEQYAEIASPNDAHRLGAKHLAQSQYRQGLVVIGQSDYREICVSPGSDVVYVIDGSEKDFPPEDNYPSVYHLLLDYAQA